ncbi:MAG TPA: hypothetical protein VL588_12260 [Bdellovibrionota bacterium]|nr:hypothetical protein [Bdellovibrionota bacterium]
MAHDGRAPRWLSWLERRVGWLAIPQLGILLVTLQALGFLMILASPNYYFLLALEPHAVMAGQVWRVVTFLSLPLTTSPLWLIFTLWFMYFVVNTLEAEWGAFRATFYVLVSVVVTVAYSFATGYPVTDISHFESSLFLAAAALYPEYEVSLFMILPIKMKWLALLGVGFLGMELWNGDWGTRGLLAATYSNYLIFFGPLHLDQIKSAIRRRRNRGRFGR